MKLCTVFHSLAFGSVLFCGTLPKLAAADNPPPADLIIYNGKVVTVNSDFTIAQAIAVRGDKIVAVGRNRQVQHFKGPATRMIDAQGRTVMPGLYDNLVDSYHACVWDSNAQPIFDSIAQAKEYIRDQAAQKTNGAWIIIERGYPTRLKEGRLPTKAELDAVAPKNPVCWNCGAIAVVNSKAIEISHIIATTACAPGSEVALDPATHKPTGLLRRASNLLKLPPGPPPPGVEQRRDALKHLYELYNQQGITSIGEGAAEPEAIDLFRDLAASNELTVRINCARYFAPGATVEETLTRLDSLTNAPAGKAFYGPTGAGDDWVRIGSLLTRVDGGLLDGTAYLRTPWGIGPTFQVSEPAFRGQLVADPDLLTALFTAAAERGWQISADCTGDAALDQLLNCFQKVQFKQDIHERRFIIRHAVFQAQQDWESCRRLGLGAEMQPDWLYCDGSALLKTFGEQRLRNFLEFKGFFDRGLLIGGGSDHEAGLDPLNADNPWNPWLGMWITLARQTAQNDGVCIAEEQLTREEAIQFYTINNAKLHFEENRKGSLETGKFADLILLDRDILKCPVEDVRYTKVQMTVVGGKVVWDAEPQAKSLASLPAAK